MSEEKNPSQEGNEPAPGSVAEPMSEQTPRVERYEHTTSSRHMTLYCSFCGKSQHEVIKLIAGPTVLICDECIGLCNDILTEEDCISPTLHGIDKLVRQKWAFDSDELVLIQQEIVAPNIPALIKRFKSKIRIAVTSLGKNTTRSAFPDREEIVTKMVACLIPLMQLVGFAGITPDEIVNELRD